MSSLIRRRKRCETRGGSRGKSGACLRKHSGIRRAGARHTGAAQSPESRARRGPGRPGHAGKTPAGQPGRQPLTARRGALPAPAGRIRASQFQAEADESSDSEPGRISRTGRRRPDGVPGRGQRSWHGPSRPSVAGCAARAVRSVEAPPGRAADRGGGPWRRVPDESPERAGPARLFSGPRCAPRLLRPCRPSAGARPSGTCAPPRRQPRRRVPRTPRGWFRCGRDRRDN